MGWDTGIEPVTFWTTITDAYGKQNQGNGQLFVAADGRVSFCFDNGTYNAWLTNTNAVINGTNYHFDSNGYGSVSNNYTNVNYNPYNWNNNWNTNRNGWQQEGSKWRYYENGWYVTNDWRSIEYQGRQRWFYFDNSGYMVTGWKEIYYQKKGRYCWFYFGSDGAMRANTNIDGYRIDADGVADKTASGNNNNCYPPYSGPVPNYNGGPSGNTHYDYDTSTKTWCEYCNKKTYGVDMCMICGYAKKNVCPNGCNVDKNKYCKFCGQKFPSTSVKYCSRCHRSVDEMDENNQRYCGNCGTHLHNTSANYDDWRDYWDDWYDRWSDWWDNH